MNKRFCLATILGAVGLVALGWNPALGQPYRQGYERDYRGYHRTNERDWRRHDRYVRRSYSYPYYREPDVVYAPPLVYGPPPIYNTSPGFNLIIPLNIR